MILAERSAKVLALVELYKKLDDIDNPKPQDERVTAAFLTYEDTVESLIKGEYATNEILRLSSSWTEYLGQHHQDLFKTHIKTIIAMNNRLLNVTNHNF